MMKTLEYFHAAHYTCSCGCRNSMRQNVERPREGWWGTCRECKRYWKYNELKARFIERYGKRLYIHNPVHPEFCRKVIEFDCDECGATNAIFPIKVDTIYYMTEGDEPQTRYEHVEKILENVGPVMVWNRVAHVLIYPDGDKVTKGKCEKCGVEYELKPITQVI